MIKQFLKKNGICDLNDRLLLSFSIVLFLPILFDFITAFTEGNSSSITLAMYIGTLVLFFFSFSRVIKPTNVFVLMGLYCVFIFNYVLFPVSQPYISSTEFILVCVYFIPIGLLFFTQIQDWTKLIFIINKFSILAILIGLYILFFTNISTGQREEVLFTYMEFSYAMLPFICASFARYFETKNKITLLIFLIGLFETISYGCRGAIIFTVIFVVLTILIYSKKNRSVIVVSCILLILLYVNLERIATYLITIDLFSNSYFLKHFVGGEMFESQRTEIYELCVHRISTMGSEISGFFGDRPYCGSIYPHNFIYEIMMQFGWIFGSLIIALYFVLIISCWLKKRSRIATVFILCSLLFKYMLSGSYLLSGQFWVATSALIAISTSKKLSNKKQ